MIKNVLALNESQDGNRIKQGDQSIMRYILSDANNDDLKLDGKQADVYLSTGKEIVYEYQTTVNQNAVDVIINEIIPTGQYTLEIIVNNKYIFPSDTKTKIEVTTSVIGKGVTDIMAKNLYGELIDFGLANGKFDKLRGPQGEQGVPGKDGLNGKDGKDGAKGEALKFEDLTEEQKAELTLKTSSVEDTGWLDCESVANGEIFSFLKARKIISDGITYVYIQGDLNIRPDAAFDGYTVNVTHMPFSISEDESFTLDKKVYHTTYDVNTGEGKTLLDDINFDNNNISVLGASFGTIGHTYYLNETIIL